MKKIILLNIILLLSLSLFNMNADDGLDGKMIFEKAKIKIFDRDWHSALKTLDIYINKYPDKEFYNKALFYKGKCYEELKKYKKALDAYEKYSKVSENKSLSEEANIAIIDISFKLSKNRSEYLKKISGYLKNSVKTIRYYAAFKLSYARNKNNAKAGVSVLRNILKNEKDQELVDRAKLALMRIDPKYLKSVNKKIDIANKNLYIRVLDKKTDKETLSLDIPFLLAKLALEALPDDEKKLLKNKGYSIDSILEKITKTGELFKLEIDDTIIKIWIE